MATFVTFQAHPDDESITVGGTMRKAAGEGHRVVLVVATGGELGEIPEGLLAEGETLVERRAAETQAAADVLGVKRLEFLGYHDSGMMGWEQNSAPEAFWNASVEEAARKLAAILVEENADVITFDDDNGGYGHPDHIQVHRVGRRAAEIAGTPRVYQHTSNREESYARWRRYAEETGAEIPDFDGHEFGKPAAELTARVDVTRYAEAKRAAMRAHVSQISEESPFLAMPEKHFAETFGTEWFIREGQGPGITETDLLAGLD
ncbi:PIG-L family deacetylase [Kutzneria sp. NPDC051319]|uniref:PIG-L family deacetylase n=1 Tax=Kutzneria sp. NPDC051319 TaxID=3155047 RepID=UPI0034232C28